MPYSRDQEGVRARALGALMLAGGLLAGVSAALPPGAARSEVLVLVLGALAVVGGATLLFLRLSPAEWALGCLVALGTALITASTWVGGTGNGTGDNQMLYIWVCLYSFYFLRPAHAIAQLGLVGASYGALLALEHVPVDTAANRMVITVATLAVVGVLVTRLHTSLERLVAELNERARHDSLTGLLNRGELEERAAVEVARARRDETELALIAVDVDDLKALNDSLGHLAGDEILRQIGRVLDSETRQVDAVGRVGGDEFVVVLPASGLAGGLRIAERLLGAVRQTARLQTPGLSVSVGVAAAQASGLTLEKLWAAADEALYRSKRGGGDRVEAAEPGRPSAAVPA